MIFSWFERTISHIGTKNGPNSFGGQQWGILDNERQFDLVIPRGGLKTIVVNLFSIMKILIVIIKEDPVNICASSCGNTEGTSVILHDWA